MLHLLQSHLLSLPSLSFIGLQILNSSLCSETPAKEFPWNPLKNLGFFWLKLFCDPVNWFETCFHLSPGLVSSCPSLFLKCSQFMLLFYTSFSMFGTYHSQYASEYRRTTPTQIVVSTFTLWLHHLDNIWYTPWTSDNTHPLLNSSFPNDQIRWSYPSAYEHGKTFHATPFWNPPNQRLPQNLVSIQPYFLPTNSQQLWWGSRQPLDTVPHQKVNRISMATFPDSMVSLSH